MKKQNKQLFLGALVAVGGYYIYTAYQPSIGVSRKGVNFVAVSDERVALEEIANKNVTAVSDYVSPLYEQEEVKSTEPGTGKRRVFVTNKMWRDDAPKKLEQEDGAIVHVRTLNDEDYQIELGLKLVEEAAEVQTAVTREELISEIGDVYEVLDCIIAFHNLSKDEIKAGQDKKRAARGSYLKKQYVTTVECLPGGFMVPYYLKDPARHPEIIV